MAKPPAGPEAIMSATEIKVLLAKAKRGDAINCALGMTKDKDAVLLLDRKKKPRKLMAELRKKGQDAGLEIPANMIRFGRAEVDGSEDARTVVFVVNKEAPGAVAVKLKTLLRPAGFGAAEIRVDEGLETESDEDETPAAEAEAAPAAPPPPPAASGPSEQAVAAALVAVGKSSQVWEATLNAVERQVGELHKKLAAAYQGHGFAAELDRAFTSKVEPMMEALDAKLVATLGRVAGASTPEARNAAVAEARDIVARFAAYLDNEPLIAKLDSNPFVPLSIEKTLTASLAALDKSLAGVATRLAA
jgi:hypothetical protein